MFKKIIKITLLIWPVISLLGIYGYSTYQRQQIDLKLLGADELVWQSAEKQLVTKIIQREEGELLHIQIEIIDSENRKVYEKTEVIDRDMFGGGFVRAAQVDQDSENEIVIWHAKGKYYLDFSKGQVLEVPFDQVPQQVKRLAESWHKYNVMAGVEVTILIIFMFSYYILYFVIMGIIKLFKVRSK